MRYFVLLSFNGAAFSGWQIQTNAESVQGHMERALTIAFGEQVAVTGAGRTDAGVNARNYIAHFDLSDDNIFDTAEKLRKINAILPSGIVVHNIFLQKNDAHARFDATSRTYNYYLHNLKDPFATFSYYYNYKIDIDAMNRAAELILGTKDFSCFEKKGADNMTSICTVTEAHWDRIDENHFVFTVTANRFLRNMVRAIVGTLLEVGRGRRPVEWVSEVIQQKDRCLAGQSVPGEALFLTNVKYPYFEIK